jgi:CheY-like chemotaxis protein
MRDRTHVGDPTLASDLLKDLGGEPAEQSAGLYGGPRIVVVEDEPAVLDLLRDVLNIRHYCVIGLKHPDVYAIAAGLHPDLFVVDLMLPHMSGIELARQLRAGCFERTPMIAMSASADFLRDASESGLFQSVLQKPFDVARLLEQVDRYASAPIEPARGPVDLPAPEESAEVSPDDQHVDTNSPPELLSMLREQQSRLALLERQLLDVQAEVVRLRRNGEGARPPSLGASAPRPSWWQRMRGS